MTENEKTITVHLSFSQLRITLRKVGADYLLIVEGGDKPHVGCIVLAVPRPSLKKDDTVSCTSSVLNVTGHKDEILCRMLAEAVAKKYQAVAVCTGGFHVDNMTPAQIQEVCQAVKNIL